MVGPHAFILGFVTLRKAFLDWATTVCIVKAGRALYGRQLSCVLNTKHDKTDMEAMDWKVARWTAAMHMRAGSEKLAASTGEGPRWYALYDSYPTSLQKKSISKWHVGERGRHAP